MSAPATYRIGRAMLVDMLRVATRLSARASQRAWKTPVLVQATKDGVLVRATDGFVAVSYVLPWLDGERPRRDGPLIELDASAGRLLAAVQRGRVLDVQVGRGALVLGDVAIPALPVTTGWAKALDAAKSSEPEERAFTMDPRFLADVAAWAKACGIVVVDLTPIEWHDHRRCLVISDGSSFKVQATGWRIGPAPDDGRRPACHQTSRNWRVQSH